MAGHQLLRLGGERLGLGLERGGLRLGEQGPDLEQDGIVDRRVVFGHRAHRRSTRRRDDRAQASGAVGGTERGDDRLHQGDVVDQLGAAEGADPTGRRPDVGKIQRLELRRPARMQCGRVPAGVIGGHGRGHQPPGTTIGAAGEPDHFGRLPAVVPQRADRQQDSDSASRFTARRRRREQVDGGRPPGPGSVAARQSSWRTVIGGPAVGSVRRRSCWRARLRALAARRWRFLVPMAATIGKGCRIERGPLRRVRSVRDRWVLNRAGITNVYQYADETLTFGGGRLLLRGVNGSGKSTAMNMLLPFLLDTDTRRIDAAGEQSQVLRSWMLSGRDEAAPVGYLWIEFRRGDDYLVCGCGIRANRSTDRVTTWWFVTPRRPGVDLALVEGRVPLSVDALRQAIGAQAVYAQDQRRGVPCRGRRPAVRRRRPRSAHPSAARRAQPAGRRPHRRRPPELPRGRPPPALRGGARRRRPAARGPRGAPPQRRGARSHRRRPRRARRHLRGLCPHGAAPARRRRTGLWLPKRWHASEPRRRPAAGTSRRPPSSSGPVRGSPSLEHDERRLRAEIAALEASDVYKQGHQLNDLRDRVELARDQGRRGGTGGATRRSPASDEATVALDQARADTDDDLRALATELADLGALAVAAGLGVSPPDVPGAERRGLAGRRRHSTPAGDGACWRRASAGRRRRGRRPPPRRR